MHLGTRRGIRACRLVTCHRKAGFCEQGFVFQFCDNHHLGQSFGKIQIYTRKPKKIPLCGKKSLLWWAYQEVA